ncbi:MAG: T9SS type A sorting domain-containing protein [Cyclobacteriaceae bacterium]
MNNFSKHIRILTQVLTGLLIVLVSTTAFSQAKIVVNGATVKLTTSQLKLNGDLIVQSGQVDAANATVNTTGAITLNGGIFSSSANTLTIGGNFTLNTGATFLHNNGSIQFNGASAQQINGTGRPTFHNLDINSDLSVETQDTTRVSGIITMMSAKTLDADGSANNRYLKLLSINDAPFVTDASIAALPSGATISGNVTVERFMKNVVTTNNGRFYRYIASPVANATIADLQNEIFVTGNFTGRSLCTNCTTSASMFYYNEPTKAYVAYPAVSNTQTLVSGRGYSVYVRGNLVTSTKFDLRGTIVHANDTDFDFHVTDSGDGWNLVGNPFASTIDWTSNTGWTKTNIDNAVYITTNTDPSGTKFASCVNGIHTLPPSADAATKVNLIASGQGFWVHTNGANPVLKANENVKRNPGSDKSTFWRTSAPINQLRINLVSATNADATVVYFTDGASVDFDPASDAWKRPNTVLNVSSVLPNGAGKVAINSQPKALCSSVVPLSIDNVPAGNYRLDFSEMSSFEVPTQITLVDKFLNTSMDVSSGSYSFAVTAATGSFGASRFELHFDVSQQPVFTASTAAVCEGTQASIRVNGAQAGRTYKVFSANGSELGSGIVANDTTLVFSVPAAMLNSGNNAFTVQSSYANCSSLAVTQAVNVRMVAAPRLNLTKGATVCAGTAVTLVAEASEGNTISWYAGATNNKVAATGNTLSIDNLQESLTFYVSATNELGCSTERIAVSALVTPMPAISSVSTATICAGNTANLTALGANGTTFQWFDDAASTQQIATNAGTFQTPVLNASKDYYVRLAGDGGCNSALQTVHVEVMNMPTITSVSNSGTICAGSTVSFTAVGQNGASFNWYADAAAAQLVASGSEVFTTPALEKTTTYYVQLSNGKGCVSAVQAVSAQVAQIPQITAVTPAQTLCAGQNTVITADAINAESFNWYADASATQLVVKNNGMLVLNNVQQSVTYYVKAINPQGCSSSIQSVSVEVSTIPSITAVTSTGAVCVGGNVELSAAGLYGETFNWYADAAGTKLVATNSGKLTVPSIQASATYYVQLTNANGCTSTMQSVTAEAIQIPQLLSVNATGTICAGNNLQIEAKGAYGNIFNWYADANGTMLIASNDGTLSLSNVSTSATYFVRVQNASGCVSDLKSVTTSVSPVPAINQVTTTGVICSGGSVTLNANGENGTVYNWYADINGQQLLASTGGSYHIPSLEATTTYYVQLVNNTGCKSVMTAVEASTSPVPNVTNVAQSAAICAGNQATLIAQGDNANQFNWYADAKATQLIETNDGTYVTEALAFNKTYYVQAIGAQGCVSSIHAVTATVNELPVVLTTTDASICSGNVATLTAMANNGSTINWYADAQGTDLIARNSNSLTTSQLVGDLTVYVQAVNSLGCTGSLKQIQVFVSAAPVLNSVVSNGATCTGGSAVFNAAGVNGSVYEWYADEQGKKLITTSAGSYTINGIAAETTVWVRLVNEKGCGTALQAVKAEVLPVPAVTSVAQSGVICRNGAVSLQANVVNGSLVRWYADSEGKQLLGSGETFQTPELNANTAFYVSAVNDLGCFSALKKVEVEVVTYNNADVLNQNGMLTSNAQTGNTWFFNGVEVSTANSITPSESGIYTLTVDVKGCKSSLDYNFVIAGLDKEQAAEMEMVAYPNPVLDELHVTLPAHTSADAVVEMVDAQGRSVQTAIPSGNEAVLDVRAVPAGLYFVHARGADLKAVRIVKQ